MGFLWTSESVTEGHPDKIADIVSDTVLDLYTSQDASARVACEVYASAGRLIVGGEVSSVANVTVEDIDIAARDVIRSIGYDDPSIGYSADDIVVDVILNQQSPEISRAVDDGEELGAGDQGMMFGYATRETAGRLPLGLAVSRALTQRQTLVHNRYGNEHIRPDGKAQVTVRYDDNGVPVSLRTVLLSIQHGEGGLDSTVVDDEIIRPVVNKFQLPVESLIVNPSGSFVVGGPGADVGLTGRKVIVDTYGSAAHHGGGAFSGKDLSKVDRSGAYAARHAAKWLVDSGLVDNTAEVRVAYGIGLPEPIDISVVADGINDGNGTATRALRDYFDFSVSALVNNYSRYDEEGNIRYNFADVARRGHFGDADEYGVRGATTTLPWENSAVLQVLGKD